MPTDASAMVTPPSVCRVHRKMAAIRTWSAVANITQPAETAKNVSRSIMTVHGPAPLPTMPMNAFVSQNVFIYLSPHYASSKQSLRLAYRSTLRL